MKTTIKDYAISLYWDARAGYYVAEIPEIPTCAADGRDQFEALANLAETFAVLKESYAEEQLPLPEPNPKLPVSVGDLSAAADVVKVAKIAELAGIPIQTLAAKVKRGTELSLGESRKIATTLADHGILIATHHASHLAGEIGSVGTIGHPDERPWRVEEVTQVREMAERNTPTRVIGMKLGRSEKDVHSMASKRGIELQPLKQGSYSKHSRSRERTVRRG